MLTETVEGYTVRYEGDEIPFKITDTENGYIVSLPERYSVEKPKFSRLFKQVFAKQHIVRLVEYAKRIAEMDVLSSLTGN